MLTAGVQAVCLPELGEGCVADLIRLRIDLAALAANFSAAEQTEVTAEDWRESSCSGTASTRSAGTFGRARRWGCGCLIARRCWRLRCRGERPAHIGTPNRAYPPYG